MWISQGLVALAGIIPAFAPLAAADAPLSSSSGPQCSFELTLTWEKYSPDGFAREMILVNGQFPGPLLEINQGDEVQVVVHNQLPFNTTVHFHGNHGCLLEALSLI